jgi:valyl-tRNA synthetase
MVKGKPSSDEKALSVSAGGVELFLPYAGLIDSEKLLAQLAKDIDKTAAELLRSEKRLSDENFVSRAKPEIVEKERQTAQELKDKLAKLEERKTLFE